MVVTTLSTIMPPPHVKRSQLGPYHRKWANTNQVTVVVSGPKKIHQFFFCSTCEGSQLKTQFTACQYLHPFQRSRDICAQSPRMHGCTNTPKT